MKKFILALLMMGWAIPAFATQYYINYGVGNDSNNGTTTLTPFNTCTPVEGVNFLKAGDIVSIYYTNIITGADAHCRLQSAGNPINHIIINSYGGSTTSAGLTITVTVSGGVVTGGTIAAAGTGYSANQIVNVGDPNHTELGNGAQFTVATVSGGVPTSITLLNGGLLYTAGTYATTNPRPRFDQSVDVTSLAGWTGWTLYQNNYKFTIPSNTISAGCVYTTPNGNQFTILQAITSKTTVYGTATSGAPNAASSTLTYSSGAGTCPSPITYSAQSLQSAIYVSNIVVPNAVTNVSIDGSYSLRRMWNEGGQTLVSLNTSVDGYYNVGGGGNLLYVELSDNTDPTTHSVRVGQNGAVNTAVVSADGTYSSYIDFDNIKVQGGFNYGFLFSGPHVTGNNILGQFNGREGIYFNLNATNNGGQGAAYGTCNNCTSQWNNGYFTGSAGQGVTIETPHTDLIDLFDSNNWMAGVDWLSYPSASPPTNPSDDRCVRCVFHNNGLRAWGLDGSGHDPTCGYVDGGHNIQIIDSVCYADGVMASQTNANSVFGFSFQTEHPSTNPDYNIDLVNSLIAAGNFFNVQSGAINCSGTACDVDDNIRLVGNTLIATGGQLLDMIHLTSTGSGLFLYNNIFYLNKGQTTGQAPGYNTSGTGVQVFPISSDYNTYYNLVSGSKIYDDTFQHANYTLTTWNTLSGQDAHSQFNDPIFVGSGTTNNIPQTYHLSSIASGQGSDSPALGVAYPNYLGSQYIYTSIGTVRTDNVVDNSAAPADGYHYLAQFQSSTFPSTQVGSDIN